MALCISPDCMRPVPKNGTRTLCKKHEGERASAVGQEKARSKKKRADSSLAKYWMLVHYKGTLLGVWYNGEVSEETGGRLVTVTYIREVESVEELPQGKLINLDTYCAGFTRHQIRKMKQYFNILGQRVPRRKQVEG